MLGESTIDAGLPESDYSGDDSSSQPEAAPLNQVELVSGANEQTVTLPDGQNVTIAALLERYAIALNIPNEDREIYVNGQRASEDQPLNPDDRVEVLRQAGRKG